MIRSSNVAVFIATNFMTKADTPSVKVGDPARIKLRSFQCPSESLKLKKLRNSRVNCQDKVKYTCWSYDKSGVRP